MADRRLSPRYFDNAEPLLSVRYQPINGVQHKPGDLIDPELKPATRMRLWMAARAQYAKDYAPTAVAEAAPSAPAEPDTPDTDSGQENGQEGGAGSEDGNGTLSHYGFTAAQNGSWWYITGPGIDPSKPVKAQGEANARAKLIELAKAADEGDAKETDGEADHGDTDGDDSDSE